MTQEQKQSPTADYPTYPRLSHGNFICPPSRYEKYSTWKSKSSSSDIHDWNETQYVYSRAEDKLLIHFVPPGSVASHKFVELVQNPLIRLGVDPSNEKMLCLEFSDASTSLGCHLLQFPSPVDGIDHFSPTWTFSPEYQALYLGLAANKNKVTNMFPCRPYDLSIIFDVDSRRRVVGIEILDALDLVNGTRWISPSPQQENQSEPKE